MESIAVRVQHPRLPFIEAGTNREWMARQGWSAEAISESCLEPDEWWFTIDGEIAGCSRTCRSMEAAFAAAESELFDAEGHGFSKDDAHQPWGQRFVEKRLASLIAAGDIRTALNLAEIRGEWAGRSAVVAEMKERYEAYKKATAELSPWGISRCTRAAREGL
ncbi:hypothetical protein ABIC83_003007 [Roseateles asaccharophilus]|uniref:hypothetical protein n=1 Tax=Roseateles asaccharophilus TaxID=582607 RepID=UPI0038387D8E